MTRIVLFNGPPSSGKDTLAKGMIGRYPNSKLEKFALPIKKTCATFYGMTMEDWNEIDGDPHLKNQPHPAFFGQSCRQVQINMSELFAKPTHDKTIFGKLAVRRINEAIRLQGFQNFFISDSGFREEAEELIKEFGADVYLIRVFRGTCSFAGDSRGYINLSDLGVKSLDLINDGTVDQALDEVKTFLSKMGAIL